MTIILPSLPGQSRKLPFIWQMSGSRMMKSSVCRRKVIRSGPRLRLQRKQRKKREKHRRKHCGVRRSRRLRKALQEAVLPVVHREAPQETMHQPAATAVPEARVSRLPIMRVSLSAILMCREEPV